MTVTGLGEYPGAAIRWEGIPYKPGRHGAIADVPGGRLLVQRAGLGVRLFHGYWNGTKVGTWGNLDEAKARMQNLYWYGTPTIPKRA